MTTFVMMNTGSPKWAGEDRGLFHTNMFLRPRLAATFKGIILSRAIQDRNQFRVSMSQIHPNGLCEVVVQKLDPKVSTSYIMDILQQCRKLVHEQISIEQESDLNQTIELSDGDDSVCAISPARFSEKKVIFKRPSIMEITPGSPSSIVLSPPTTQNSSTENNRQNFCISLSPSTPIRTVKIADSKRSTDESKSQLKRPSLQELESTAKRQNIVVHVVNDIEPRLQDPVEPSLISYDASASVVCLGESDDNLPSASTWASSHFSKFPLSNISKKLGAKENNGSAGKKDSEAVTQSDDANSSITILGVSDDNLPSAPTWANSPLLKFPLSNITKKLGAKENDSSAGKKDSEAVTQSDDANSSITILGVSDDNLPSAPTWANSPLLKFPLSNTTKKLGAKENDSSAGKKDSEAGTQRYDADLSGFTLRESVDNHSSAPAWTNNNWTNVNPSKFPLSNISKILGAKENNSSAGNENSKSAIQDVPKLNKSEVLQRRKFSDVLKVNLHQADESVPSSEIPRTHAISLTCKMGGMEVSFPQSATPGQNSPSSQTSSTSQSNKKCASPKNCGNSSRVERIDDDIVIEKEIKSAPQTLCQPLTIDDSDDDIAVCEVVNVDGKISKSKKRKQKKREKQLKIVAGTNFVASTSSVPAPDYIPLNATYRRIDPKSSNNFIPLNQTNRRSDPKTSSNYKHLERLHTNHREKLANMQKMKGKHEKKSQVMQMQSRRHQEHLSNGVKKSRWDSAQPSNEVKKSHFDSTQPPKEDNNKPKHVYDGNLMNPNSGEPKTGLRPIVIDASNVAIGHGRGAFSVPGLKICIKYFTDKGHKVVAFAPKYRRFHVSPEDRKTLDDLETEGILSYTPSRTLQSGKKVASYDDRFIIQTAVELGGVVVSTDNFRDLLVENESWRETIEKRLLMFTWVGDMLLFPNDPLGREGPHLQEFLRFPDQNAQTLDKSAPQSSTKSPLLPTPASTQP